MKPGEFSLLGYATRENKNVLASLMRLGVANEVEFLLSPDPSHQSHVLVKTSSSEIISQNVGKTVPEHPTLKDFVTWLKNQGFTFWLLHEYVMDRHYQDDQDRRGFFR
jgi:hypothetical protein